METQTSPVAAAVVTHDVENYERWKLAFDGHASSRRTAGIISTHINRDAENPNRLSVYLAGTDAAKLDAFLKSRDLADTMVGAGVKGPPHVAAITPVEDRTQKEPLAGVIIRHEVQDYDAWKQGFDGNDAKRKAAGIVGYAVNRSAHKPNLVVVYLQAKSLEALRAFASSATLEQNMKAAGVIGAPELTFVQGGTWEA
jgi:quinol monooxygenase YgiN